MRIARLVCLNKFSYLKKRTSNSRLHILDVGCGNNSPTLTKYWFPDCHYSGADIQQYNNSNEDLTAMDAFYPVGVDGSGYSKIPDRSFDYIILHHVIEHMADPLPILAILCSKLREGGYIWIAFPSVRSLSLPHASHGTLQFCDDASHCFLPDLREVANILLANGTTVLHAGRSREPLRSLIGLVLLPWAFLKWCCTKKLEARGLWYILGFEDHVFGQRRVTGLPPISPN